MAIAYSKAGLSRKKKASHGQLSENEGQEPAASSAPLTKFYGRLKCRPKKRT